MNEYRRGSIEEAMAGDAYKILKRYDPPQKNTEYWESMIAAVNGFTKKYGVTTATGTETNRTALMAQSYGRMIADYLDKLAHIEEGQHG